MTGGEDYSADRSKPPKQPYKVTLLSRAMHGEPVETGLRGEVSVELEDLTNAVMTALEMLRDVTILGFTVEALVWAIQNDEFEPKEREVICQLLKLLDCRGLRWAGRALDELMRD